MFNKIDLDGGNFELFRAKKTQDTRRFNGKLSVTYRLTQAPFRTTRKKNGMKEHFDSIYTVEYAMSV